MSSSSASGSAQPPPPPAIKRKKKPSTLTSITKAALEYAYSLSPSFPKTRFQLVSDLHLEMPPPPQGNSHHHHHHHQLGPRRITLNSEYSNHHHHLPPQPSSPGCVSAWTSRRGSIPDTSSSSSGSHHLLPPPPPSPGRFLSSPNSPLTTIHSSSSSIAIPPPPDHPSATKTGYTTYFLPPKAPLLVLAGDIGSLAHGPLYRHFLRAQSHNFDHIYLVLGNHELYNLPGGRSEGISRALEWQNTDEHLKGHLTVLNRTRVDLWEKGVTLLGCTLHSLVTPLERAKVERHLNDFRGKIGGGWGVELHNGEFGGDVEWLRGELEGIHREAREGREREREKDKEREPVAGRQGQHQHHHQSPGMAEKWGSLWRVVVVTHHAPTFARTSKPEDEGSGVGSAFATELFEVPPPQPPTASSSSSQELGGGGDGGDGSSDVNVQNTNGDSGRNHSPNTNGTTQQHHQQNIPPSGPEKGYWGGGFASWKGAEKVSVWMFGHTHFCTDYTWKGTTPPTPTSEGGSNVRVRLVANQRGYWFTREGEKYDPGFVVEV